jgi:predicted cobalt transporter CbtA
MSWFWIRKPAAGVKTAVPLVLLVFVQPDTTKSLAFVVVRVPGLIDSPLPGAPTATSEAPTPEYNDRDIVIAALADPVTDIGNMPAALVITVRHRPMDTLVPLETRTGV